MVDDEMPKECNYGTATIAVHCNGAAYIHKAGIDVFSPCGSGGSQSSTRQVV